MKGQNQTETVVRYFLCRTIDTPQEGPRHNGPSRLCQDKRRGCGLVNLPAVSEKCRAACPTDLHRQIKWPQAHSHSPFPDTTPEEQRAPLTTTIPYQRGRP